MSVPEAYKEVVNDLVSMLENGTSNDVTITLMDGEIKANKDVLMTRSNYFSSMLRNDSKYVESQSGIVNMSYVKNPTWKESSTSCLADKWISRLTPLSNLLR